VRKLFIVDCHQLLTRISTKTFFIHLQEQSPASDVILLFSLSFS